jgi:hypothetical protein
METKYLKKELENLSTEELNNIIENLECEISGISTKEVVSKVLL